MSLADHHLPAGRPGFDSATVRRLLLTGQCTLHWGRMEFGNIGNYYIVEPLVRELHRVFPAAEIRTTFQMSAEFARRERVTVLPMELYYGWLADDRARAEAELASARVFVATSVLPVRTPYIDEVLSSDLVVDFSGDMWGDNASLLGPDRLHVGFCKDRVAQLLGRPTVMLAGSPGPFATAPSLDFARETFAHFAWVTNREPLSRPLLAAAGFRVDHVVDAACPAFLFSGAGRPAAAAALAREGVQRSSRPVAIMIVCGWNFQLGPFDRWPREDAEYASFVAAVRCLSEELGFDVWLLSHANGFPPAPAPFALRPGRDFAVMEQLDRILRGTPGSAHVTLLRGPFTAAETSALIGTCDLLVSGRVHGAVAGLAQEIPTVIIDYGHEPKAHKLRGMAETAGAGDRVAAPTEEVLVEHVRRSAGERELLRARLARSIPAVKALARHGFDGLPQRLASIAFPKP